MTFDLEMYKNIKVEVASSYVREAISYEKEGRRWFHFVQEDLVEDWHEYSSCFLGEVWVDCDDLIAKVVMVLENNKAGKDHLTIVNPDCYDVRILPHQIVELVVYDLRFGSQDEWTCDWAPISNVNVEQIGYDYLNLYSWYNFGIHEDPPDYRYALLPRVEMDDAKPCRQHHFWYRFDKSVLNQAGMDHVGDFVLKGCADKFLKGRTQESTFHASVYLDARKLKKGRVLHTLGLESKDNCSSYTYKHSRMDGFPRSNGIVVYNGQKKKKNKRKYKIHEPVLPQTKEVVINRLQTTSFEEGCKVLDAMPQWTPEDDPYDGYSDYDDPWYRQGYGPGVHGIIPYHKHRGPMD